MNIKTLPVLLVLSASAAQGAVRFSDDFSGGPATGRHADTTVPTGSGGVLGADRGTSGYGQIALKYSTENLV